MKSLFKSQAQPTLMPPGTPEPQAGPNAFEVCVVSYDPDQNMLVIGMANDVQAFVKLDECDPEGTGIDMLLKDAKLGPRLRLHAKPATPLPKFSSPEEADAWLEANS